MNILFKSHVVKPLIRYFILSRNLINKSILSYVTKNQLNILFIFQANYYFVWFVKLIIVASHYIIIYERECFKKNPYLCQGVRTLVYELCPYS